LIGLGPVQSRFFCSLETGLPSTKRDILYRLAEGEGIATQEWDGVLEKCYVCDKWMLEAVFQHHSRDCWHTISDEETESEPDRWGME
jgi:hypothetical protein